MNKENVELLIKTGMLRKKQIDKEKIKSLIDFAETNARVAKSISLNNDSATLIFREIYESIRQLGEAKWLIDGYEPQGLGTHTISLDALKEIDLIEKVKLNYLDRFKQIRHDANYRGIRVSISQTREILEFWDSCGKEITMVLKKLVGK